MSPCAVTAPENVVKQPSEVRQYTMDFANTLATGETISTITSVSIELRGGGLSDVTVYNEAVSGDTIVFWVSGGTDGQTHRIEIVVVTNVGQTIEGDGLLSIRDE
jgi:hypothetical protein